MSSDYLNRVGFMHDFVGNMHSNMFVGSRGFSSCTFKDSYIDTRVSEVEEKQIDLKENGELEDGEIGMDMVDEIIRRVAVQETQEDMEIDSLSLHATERSVDRDCFEEDILEDYSAYRKKFGSYDDRLPSPTPSEDTVSKDDDCSGEVSSSLLVPALNMAQSSVANVGSKVCIEPLSGFAMVCQSKRKVSFEDSNQDGPALKRQRTELSANRSIQLKPGDPRRVLHNGMLQSVEIDKNPNNPTQLIEKPRNVNAEDNSCILSSASTNAEQKTDVSSTLSDVKHLFDKYDDHQIDIILKERKRRFEEQKKMFAERKLSLVLDLDHTLLNSAKFTEISPVHEEMLRWNEEQERGKPYKHLFRLPHMALWTKLRPGIWNFLEKASKLCELHICTMGNKLYATEMAKILDPTGVLFARRVISKGDDNNGDDRVLKTKDLDGVLGMESSVVIIDDCKKVWPHNRKNLIAIERYMYFPCSRQQFGLSGQSLLEIERDERPEDGALASSLAVIERLHETFFSHRDLDEADVRVILAAEQRKILSGCRIVFSHIFPVAEMNPHLHPLWKLAEKLGASCTNRIDEKVTHVVANAPGTDKVKWALSTGRFVVRPNWVQASAVLYGRAKEQDFTI